MRLALVTFGPVGFPARLALTPAEHAQGLSGSPPDAMLFLFPDTKESRTIWMRGMRFPLDVLFLRQHRIVRVFSRLMPGSDARYVCPEACDALLELPAGLLKFPLGFPSGGQGP